MKKITLLVTFCLLCSIGQTQTTVLNEDLSPITVDETERGTLEDEDLFTTGPVNNYFWYSRRNTSTNYDHYFNIDDDAEIIDGKLVLHCRRKDQYILEHKKWYNISCGEAVSYKTYKYGYFEIRAKLARGKGMHSSFWFFGGNGAGESHEIDVFEASRSASLTASNTLYNGGNSGTGNETLVHFGTNVHHFYKVTDSEGNVKKIDTTYRHGFGTPKCISESLSESFNTYAVEWTPFDVTWYFNNREIRSMNVDDFISRFGFDPSDIFEQQLRLSLGYDHRLDEYSIDGQMEIDYVRVWQKPISQYKEKPIINGNTTVCGSPYNMRFEADPSSYKSGDSFKWEIIDNAGYIYYNDDDNDYVYVNFNSGKRTMTLKLTITDVLGNSSNRIVTITNRMDPYFFIDNYTCSSGNASISLIANSNNTGSEWSIFKSDEFGNIDGNCLDHGWNPETYTFDNLEGNRYYLLKHGVWNSGCSSWSEAKRVYNTRLQSSFDNYIEEHTYYYNTIDIAHDNSSSTLHRWTLHESDASGALLSQIGNPQWGTIGNFNNLSHGVDKYYIIRHGVWSSCNTWSESRRLIHVPLSISSCAKSAITDEILQTYDESSFEINVFPNPATENITIDASVEVDNISLLDIKGQLLNTYNPNEKLSTINCDNIPGGVYFLIISSKEVTKTEKIIIKK